MAMVLSKRFAPLPEVVLRGRRAGEAVEIALDQVPDILAGTRLASLASFRVLGLGDPLYSGTWGCPTALVGLGFGRLLT